MNEWNIPEEVRNAFREAHRKFEKEQLKKEQEDPLTDEFIQKLKKDVQSGKPMTKEDIDSLVSQIEFLDSAGDTRAQTKPYHV